MIGAACAALLPLAALAQGHDGSDSMPGHGRGMGMHGSESEILSGVALTDGQKSQIQSIHQAGWAAAKPMMQQLHAIDEQIRDLLLTPGTVNTGTLTSLRAQQTTLRQQLDDQRMSTILQVRGALTSAQISQAAATHQQMEALHTQMHNLTHPGAASSAVQ
jgi:Spy/CpxP family protein refolding chaperone